MALKGPLGIWGYPLLNLLREFLQKLQQKQSVEAKPSLPQKSYSNIEEYEVFEEDGVIKIKVHREASRGEDKP